MGDRIMVVLSLAISCVTFLMCLGSMVYMEDKVDGLKPKEKEPERGKGPIFYEEDGTVFKPRI